MSDHTQRQLSQFLCTGCQLFDSCDPSSLIKRAVNMAFGMLSSDFVSLHAQGRSLMQGVHDLES